MATYFANPEYKEVALQAARESLVLLKNEEGTLPLSRNQKVLLTGPTANTVTALHGAWSYTWQGYKEALYPDEIKTIKDALPAAQYVPSIEFHEKEEKVFDLNQVLRAARNSDVIVLCLGEISYAETPGNIPDLAFPENQKELIAKLSQTGKPIVVVLLEGRPRIIREIEPMMDGLVAGFWPGSQGAQAVADVLYGDFNPSGKLPITDPRYSGNLSTYDHKRLDEAAEIDDPYKYYYEFKPQYEFGHGLSYTSFEYGQVNVNADTITSDLKVSISITNTGDRAGQEVVSLYTRDHYASITPSVRRLRRFVKINLKPGETKERDCTLTKADVSFVNQQLKKAFE